MTRTNSKKYPSAEKPLVQVLQVRFFTLPEETWEIFRTDLSAVISDPFADTAGSLSALWRWGGGQP